MISVSGFRLDSSTEDDQPDGGAEWSVIDQCGAKERKLHDYRTLCTNEVMNIGLNVVLVSALGGEETISFKKPANNACLRDKQRRLWHLTRQQNYFRTREGPCEVPREVPPVFEFKD